MKINNHRIVYYALIKAGFAESQFEMALMKLVLLVIKNKNYNRISVRLLCKDFQKFIGFELPYFPMLNILDLAYKSGYLEQNRNKEYIPKYTLIKDESFMETIVQKQNTYDELVKDFIKFVKEKHSLVYTNVDAERVIKLFIEEQGVLFFNEKKSYFNVPHDDYIFATYLKYDLDGNSGKFDFVNELVVGRILSELVLYDEKAEAGDFSNKVVYLDTGFVFRLLGIDELNRKEICIQLVCSMQSLGIDVKMYEHSYNELIGIINKSEPWIGNPEYDPFKASQTTHYFVSNNIKKEEITEIVSNIKSDLLKLGVGIEETDYPQALPPNVLFEQDYYKNIVEYYTKTNPSFNEDEKKYTIEQDARSFFYTMFKSRGIVANQLSDVKHLFVTTNTSLATISRNICQNIPGTTMSSIPFCVSDVFLGVVLWRKNPDAFLETNEKRLITAMYSAFLPSDKMLLKLTESLKECEENESLTPEQCYLLKTNKAAHAYLMDKTKGNPEAFTELTSLEIFQGIRSESEAEGRRLERVLANEELISITSQLESEKDKTHSLTIKEINYQIELLEAKRRTNSEKIVNIDYKINEQNIKKISAENKALFSMRCLALTYIIIFIAYMALGVLFWEKSKETDYFSLFCFIAPAIIIVGSYVYFAVTGKSFDIFKWTESVKKIKEEKYFRELGYDEVLLDGLKFEKKQLNEDDKFYQNQIDELQERRELAITND